MSPKTCKRNKNTPGVDCSQDNNAEWATSDKDSGYRDEKRGPHGGGGGQSFRPGSDWLRRGRLFGRLHQSEQRFLNKGLGKRCVKVTSTICLPFIDHTHTACTFDTCDILRTSHVRTVTAKTLKKHR